MKKLLNIFLVLLLGFVVAPQLNAVYAADCGAPATGLEATFPGFPVTQSHVITINLSSNFDTSHDYQLVAEDGIGGIDKAISAWFPIDEEVNNKCNGGEDCVSVRNGVVTWTITSPAALKKTAGAGGKDTYYVDLNSPFGTVGANQCDVGKYYASKTNNPGNGCTVEVFQNRGNQTCYQNQTENACFATGVPISVKYTNLVNTGGEPWEGKVGLKVIQKGVAGEWDGAASNAVNGSVTLSFTPNAGSGSEYTIGLKDVEWVNERFPDCNFDLQVESGCNTNQCAEKQSLNIGEMATPESVGPDNFSLCRQIPEVMAEQRAACFECTGGSDEENEENKGVWTAIGCIKREPQAIMQRLISIGLGMSGGVALLTFLAAGFIFSTSQGDPKAYGKAKEMMTAAVIGIIFVIFSVTLLQFIGYEVLKIPGFGG